MHHIRDEIRLIRHPRAADLGGCPYLRTVSVEALLEREERAVELEARLGVEDPGFDAVETTLAVQQMLEVLTEEERAALAAPARRHRALPQPRREHVGRRCPDIAASRGTDPTAGAEDRVMNLSRTAGSLGCGNPPVSAAINSTRTSWVPRAVARRSIESACRIERGTASSVHAARSYRSARATRLSIRSRQRIRGNPAMLWIRFHDTAR
jgi:hypothetical protein